MYALSVDRAMRAFQAAVVGLIPAAEMEGMSWRAEDAHDEWELLVARLFDVFVLRPIEQSEGKAGSQFPLPNYDFDHPDYSKVSWIQFGDTESGISKALVRLVSRGGPFDSVELALVDERAGTLRSSSYLTEPVAEGEFSLLFRTSTGSTKVSDLYLPE